MSLRDECVDDDGHARTWADVTQLHGWELAEADDSVPAYRDPAGDIVQGTNVTRFTPEYASTRYAELADADRAFLAEASNPYTGMITLTSSSRNAVGGWRCPADVLDDLLDGLGNALNQLRNRLSGHDSMLLTVIGTHRSGYAHAHIGIWIDGRIDHADLEGTVDSFVRNCEAATSQHHPYEEAITIRRAAPFKRRLASHDGPEKAPMSPLATYIARHLPCIEGALSDAEAHVQRHAAVLWATDKRYWRPSRTFREWAGICEDRDESVDENEDWEFVGMAIDGDIHGVENPKGGGASMTAVKGLPTWVDPPPT